ncbi:conserved hypothetical protein [Edwardsiella phage PEi26]|uniref:Uncharacterized protein n=1 Tax=Edwardsiella phage PEi26 TaxID=1608311 RepID=A0A0B6VTU3_9CAUD|nr:conserved hypothetical protein [Edwardsiella phage PEi26]
MEIIAGIAIYLAIGAVSTAFFKLVEDFFIEIDSDTAAFVVLGWPIFWLFFILKVVTYPIFWLCAAIFD